MASNAEAFCPGHITAFFEVHENPEPKRKGSRGVGLCLSKGVRTRVEVRGKGKGRVTTFLNGREERAETTEGAIRGVTGPKAWDVVVDSTVELPVSQGFGMSGAGALSAVLALDGSLDLGRPRDELVAVAHAAEVEAGTGLGDVYPQALGGMDIRLKPGAPPHGLVKRIPLDAEVLVCVVGTPIKTRDVLRNPRLVARINQVGAGCIEAFSQDPRIDNLFLLAQRFDAETGLADHRLQRAMEDCRPHGSAAMSMLGHSLFAMGDVPKLLRVLGKYGDPLLCRVDNHGGRVLPPKTPR